MVSGQGLPGALLLARWGLPAGLPLWLPQLLRPQRGSAHIWSFISTPPPTSTTRPPATPSDAISLVVLKLSASPEAAGGGPGSSAATTSASTCLLLLLLLPLLLQGAGSKWSGGWQLQSGSVLERCRTAARPPPLPVSASAPQPIQTRAPPECFVFSPASATAAVGVRGGQRLLHILISAGIF